MSGLQTGIPNPKVAHMQVLREHYPHFEQLLAERSKVLRREIRETLLRADAERYADLAGQVHDVSEESLANLLVTVNRAEVARDIVELNEIHRAQKRIQAGTYGICGDCRGPITRARLEANPSALRCITCQQTAERTGPSTPVFQ